MEEESKIVCEFVGLNTDPATKYNFPSDYNTCHRITFGAPISIAHQGEYCLSGKFSKCPIYNKETDSVKSHPKEVLQEADVPGSEEGSKRNFIFAFILVVVIISIGGYIVSGGFSTFGFIPGQSVSTPTAPAGEDVTVIDTPRPTTTPTPLPSNTPTTTPSQTETLTPTITSTPSETPIPSPGPALGTPFGKNLQLLIYTIREGQSIRWVAKQFGTSYEAIDAVNFLVEGASVWPGQRIVVPVNIVDATDIPKFEILFTSEEVSLAKLADEYGSQKKLIREYNDLGDGEVIPQGRWVVIPVVKFD